MKVEQTSAKKEIRNFLLTIFGAVMFAALVVYGMVNYYEPSKNYVLDKVLLSPDTMNQVGVREIKHMAFESDTNQWKTQTIPFSRYEIFYSAVAGTKSVRKVTEEMEMLFSSGKHSSLMIMSLPSDNLSGKSSMSIFQEVQISENGDVFRVELRDYNSVDRWAYFKYDKGSQPLNRILLGR